MSSSRSKSSPLNKDLIFGSHSTSSSNAGRALNRAGKASKRGSNELRMCERDSQPHFSGMVRDLSD